MTDPMAVTVRLYKVCGLDLNDSVKQYLLSRSAHWKSKTSRWDDLLDDEEVGRVRAVLDGSCLRDLWHDEQIVSRFDYVI